MRLLQSGIAILQHLVSVLKQSAKKYTILAAALIVWNVPALAASTYNVWTNCRNTPAWPIGGPNDRFTLVGEAGDQIQVTFSGASGDCVRILLPPMNGDGTYTINSSTSIFQIANARKTNGQDLVLTFVVADPIPVGSFGSNGWSGGTLYSVGQYSYSSEGSTSGNGIALNFGKSPNAAPTVSNLPLSVTTNEDRSSDVNLSSAVFADADGDTLTVELSVSAGAFSTPANAPGVVASLVSGSAIRLVGLPADINTYLDTPSNIKYTTAANAAGPNVASVTVTASDGTANLASNPTISIDSSSTPDVTNVTSAPSSVHYKAGSIVPIGIAFDEAVNVTGMPNLSVNVGATGRVASYASGSGSTVLTFNYTVQAGDAAIDLDYLASNALTLNGGALKNAGNSDADLALPSPGAAGSLSANANIVIDTTEPVVSAANLTLTGASGAGGTAFKVGDTITAAWAMVSGDGDSHLSASLGGVAMDFSAFGGGASIPATLSGGAWTASYTLQANSSLVGSNFNVSLTAYDEAGNSKTRVGTNNPAVDASPPVVSAGNIKLTGATGTGDTFKIGDTVVATWDNAVAGDNNPDVASVSIDFSQFGGGLVNASQQSEIWTASFTILAGDIDASNNNVVVTALDAVGNSSNQASHANVPVDNAPPTVVDAHITVSGATGPSNAFKIGDTVLVQWSANNVDSIEKVVVDFSMFGGSSTAQTQQNGDIWSASLVLVAGSINSSSVEVSVGAFDNAGNLKSITKATVFTVNALAPTVVVTGPLELVTSEFNVNIKFSEPVSTDLVAAEFKTENATVLSVTPVAGSATQFVAAIVPVMGKRVLVQVLPAAVTNSGGNANLASNEYTVTAANVAWAFEKYNEKIKEIIVKDAQRALRQTLSSNQRMSQAARERFMENEVTPCDKGADPASKTSECAEPSLQTADRPMKVYAAVENQANTLSAKGKLLDVAQVADSPYKRIITSEFDMVRDDAAQSRTETFSARLAWERMVSKTTLFGYMVSADLAQSEIKESFQGDMERRSLTLGAYAVHKLREGLYADAFITLGQNQNDLSIRNDVLSLLSTYKTQSLSLGLALTGVYNYQSIALHPEVALAFGKTHIGGVQFTGHAYGLVDDKLSLDAGDVKISQISLRPEVRIPLDSLAANNTKKWIHFAPTLVCEHLESSSTTGDCRSGAELGFKLRLRGGFDVLDFILSSERANHKSRNQVRIKMEKRF